MNNKLENANLLTIDPAKDGLSSSETDELVRLLQKQLASMSSRHDTLISQLASYDDRFGVVNRKLNEAIELLTDGILAGEKQKHHVTRDHAERALSRLTTASKVLRFGVLDEPGPEGTYLVLWRIELEEEGVVEAAKEALGIHRDPDSAATVFEVKDLHTGEWAVIDLDPENGSAVSVERMD